MSYDGLMTTPEKRPMLDSSCPWICSSEEIATTSQTPAQTFRRTVAVLLFQLIGCCFGDDVCLIVVHIIECQFCPSCDGLSRKEGEIVDINVSVVVGDGVDGTVRIAGVVDEAGRPPKMHAVAHVFRTALLLTPLVKFHKIDFLVQCSCHAATVGFVMRNDLATVGIDELAPLDILLTAESW